MKFLVWGSKFQVQKDDFVSGVNGVGCHDMGMQEAGEHRNVSWYQVFLHINNLSSRLALRAV
jgi:hypothetical protein